MAADGDCHHLCKLMAPVRHRWSINDVIGGIRNTVMPSDCSPMGMLSLKLLLLLMALLGYGATKQTSCRYWCQSATYPPSYYCCPNGGLKPGVCPTFVSCPPYRQQQQVILCTSDNACAGEEKCCYHPCHGIYVCLQPAKLAKPPR
ncbi:uncharacterized protein [Periplaneta americana]|uniref:uncharacterized protein n=1 Tax=Periplaneta americana TaxID=6978 RepID=UPI0037E94B8E